MKIQDKPCSTGTTTDDINWTYDSGTRPDRSRPLATSQPSYSGFDSINILSSFRTDISSSFAPSKSYKTIAWHGYVGVTWVCELSNLKNFILKGKINVYRKWHTSIRVPVAPVSFTGLAILVEFIF